MNRHYLDLLLCLNEFKVRYLIIGGYAVIRYTEPRYTKDLDIWIEASTSNARRVMTALEKFGAPIDNLTVEELAKPGLIYVFGLPPLRVDFLNKASGCSFDVAWQKREGMDLGELTANVVSIEVLIKLKKAAARPQDLADLAKLQPVKRKSLKKTTSARKRRA